MANSTPSSCLGTKNSLTCSISLLSRLTSSKLATISSFVRFSRSGTSIGFTTGPSGPGSSSLLSCRQRGQVSWLRLHLLKQLKCKNCLQQLRRTAPMWHASSSNRQKQRNVVSGISAGKPRSLRLLRCWLMTKRWWWKVPSPFYKVERTWSHDLYMGVPPIPPPLFLLPTIQIEWRKGTLSITRIYWLLTSRERIEKKRAPCWVTRAHKKRSK